MNKDPKHSRILALSVYFITCCAGWAATTATGADIRQVVAYNGERQLRINGDRTIPTHVEVESTETRFGVFVRVRSHSSSGRLA